MWVPVFAPVLPPDPMQTLVGVVAAVKTSFSEDTRCEYPTRPVCRRHMYNLASGFMTRVSPCFSVTALNF